MWNFGYCVQAEGLYTEVIKLFVGTFVCDSSYLRKRKYCMDLCAYIFFTYAFLLLHKAILCLSCLQYIILLVLVMAIEIACGVLAIIFRQKVGPIFC